MYCEVCKKEVKSFKGLCTHMKTHNITILEYYIKYKDYKTPICECGDKCKFKRVLEFYKTCCSKKCIKNIHKQKHSDETKNKLSIIRKKWLNDNPEKHPWKLNSKFISNPCEKLKMILLENDINFKPELKPLTDRGYSIDIAIIDKGIGIEVNGNQHYNSNKTLKEYYKKRKEEIEEKGWTLYDIHYTLIYKEDFIKNLIDLLKGANDNINLEFELIKIKINYCTCGKKILNNSKMCSVCDKTKRRIVIRPDLITLKEEVHKLGYSGVGRKYGVSDTAIRKWIKNYENENS